MAHQFRSGCNIQSSSALNRELQPASLLQGSDSITSLDWSADGNLLAAACDDGILRIYSRDRRFSLTDRLEGHGSDMTEVAFSPDGSMLASGSFDGTALVRSVEPGFPILHQLELDGDLLHRTIWSPDGQFLALVSNSGLMRILETREFSGVF